MVGGASQTSGSTINLHSIFHSLQTQMIAVLSTDRENILHPGTKGDATELAWKEMLDKYLPIRYKVEKAFVLDSHGHLSDQIDIVIFDRHHSPLLFHQDGAVYVPAESVYAIAEIKQDLSKAHIEYAGKKAESVRCLHRTSVPIPHAGGTYPAKVPFDILAGILTLESSWKPSLGPSFEDVISSLPPLQRIDLGCALRDGSFEVQYGEGQNLHITRSEPEDSLIFFFLKLLSRLQGLATVTAIDIEAYARSLDGE